MGEWTLFSNHGHVLVCLANNHQARLRDVAAEVGITERAVQNILRELQASGLVQISKHGRCNHYQINTRKSLRHPLEAHCTVGKLLQLLKSGAAEQGDTEVAVEPEPKAGKTRPAPKPEKAEPPVASTSSEGQASTGAPLENAVVAVKSIPEIPPVQAIPLALEAAEDKPAKKASKDKEKNKPAGDQQGSLF